MATEQKWNPSDQEGAVATEESSPSAGDCLKERVGKKPLATDFTVSPNSASHWPNTDRNQPALGKQLLGLSIALIWPVGAPLHWLLCLFDMFQMFFEHCLALWHKRYSRLILFFPCCPPGRSSSACSGSDTLCRAPILRRALLTRLDPISLASPEQESKAMSLRETAWDLFRLHPNLLGLAPVNCVDGFWFWVRSDHLYLLTRKFSSFLLILITNTFRLNSTNLLSTFYLSPHPPFFSFLFVLFLSCLFLHWTGVSSFPLFHFFPFLLVWMLNIIFLSF